LKIKEIYISIALCTYNGEKYIEEQLQSLADQSLMGSQESMGISQIVDGIVVNKKRVYRLMGEHNLNVKGNPRLITKVRTWNSPILLRSKFSISVIITTQISNSI